MGDTLWPQKNTDEKSFQNPLIWPKFLQNLRLSLELLLIRYKIDSLKFGVNSLRQTDIKSFSMGAPGWLSWYSLQLWISGLGVHSYTGCRDYFKNKIFKKKKVLIWMRPKTIFRAFYIWEKMREIVP